VATAADLHLVEPLWIAVHHRHAETMPELAPFVGDDESWAVRKVLYEELLVKPDTLLLLAFDGSAAIGYGLAHVMAVEDSWIPDTWQTGQRIGEVESLSVPGVSRQWAGLGAARPTRGTSSCPWCAGPDPRRATWQRRRDPPVPTARVPADLALPFAVRGQGLTAHRRSRTNR
jgi:hypothetical protein